MIDPASGEDFNVRKAIHNDRFENGPTDDMGSNKAILMALHSSER